MRPLSILILSDGRPGHYHLAEGVAAAIARRRPAAVTKIDIRRAKWAPSRVLAALLDIGIPAAGIARLAYGLDGASGVPTGGPLDLIISAGGDTLGANVAMSRALACRNIFCGTLRHFRPDAFDLVVSSYARHARLPRHLVALKPNGLDPDTLPASRVSGTNARAGPPQRAGLLIGGNSGLFRYRDQEWTLLLDFLAASHRAHGTRWIVSTSRRSPEAIADRLQALARQAAGPIAELIDFRVAGPGSLPRLFAGVEAVLVTEDSSTMISEAVCARLPVVGTAPAEHAFKDDEREYRAFMIAERWLRTIPLATLSPGRFVEALADVEPLRVNHLDRLAEALAEQLPDLFTPPPLRPAPGAATGSAEIPLQKPAQTRRPE